MSELLLAGAVCGVGIYVEEPEPVPYTSDLFEFVDGYREFRAWVASMGGPDE